MSSSTNEPNPNAVAAAARILVVDDAPANVKLLADRLAARGYDIATATSGAEALEQVESWRPDLVLLDIVMPGMNGYEVCRRIRAGPGNELLPIIMITALDPEEERIKGLESGADDFLAKPVSQAELEARVRSLLRIKSLYDEVQLQARQLAEWGQKLEARVQEQVAELERFARLKRFLSPQVAEMVISSGQESLLDSHRQHIAALFCDLRGFSHFSETSEPEDVIAVLQAYHEAMGRLIHDHGGTLEHRAGDGIMVIFNDPLPCDGPALVAVETALAMHERMQTLITDWRSLGHELGFGVGISLGYATLGVVGFEGRFDYSANGSVVNLAARLADEARDGQILVSQRVHTAVVDQIESKALGELSLKGSHEPTAAYLSPDSQSSALTPMAVNQERLGAAQRLHLIERRGFSTPAHTGCCVICSKNQKNLQTKNLSVQGASGVAALPLELQRRLTCDNSHIHKADL